MEQKWRRGVVLFILTQGFAKTTKAYFPDSSKSSWVFVSADFKARLGLRCLVKTQKRTLYILFLNRSFLSAVFRGQK